MVLDSPDPVARVHSLNQRAVASWVPPSASWERRDPNAAGSSDEASSAEDGAGAEFSSLALDSGQLASLGSTVWKGHTTERGTRAPGKGSPPEEAQRMAVRHAVLAAAAMPTEAWQLEYSMEVHGLIDERVRMQKVGARCGSKTSAESRLPRPDATHPANEAAP